ALTLSRANDSCSPVQRPSSPRWVPGGRYCPIVSAVLPSPAEKPRYVAEMFGRIARRYDLMNTLMTFGQDVRWRRAVPDARPGAPHNAVLDIGTGTGRLTEAVLHADPTAQVVGVDFALGMLRRAPPHL